MTFFSWSGTGISHVPSVHWHQSFPQLREYVPTGPTGDLESIRSWKGCRTSHAPTNDVLNIGVGLTGHDGKRSIRRSLRYLQAKERMQRRDVHQPLGWSPCRPAPRLLSCKRNPTGEVPRSLLRHTLVIVFLSFSDANVAMWGMRYRDGPPGYLPTHDNPCMSLIGLIAGLPRTVWMVASGTWSRTSLACLRYCLSSPAPPEVAERVDMSLELPN